MSDVVSALFGDMHQAAASLTIGRTITYRLFVSSKLNPATGKQVEVFHDVRILDAVLTSVDAREMIAGGPLQVGDRRYEFDAGWLADETRYATARAMTTSDRIVDGAASYRVILWDDAGPITKVTVRK